MVGGVEKVEKRKRHDESTTPDSTLTNIVMLRSKITPYPQIFR